MIGGVECGNRKVRGGFEEVSLDGEGCDTRGSAIG